MCNSWTIVLDPLINNLRTDILITPFLRLIKRDIHSESLSFVAAACLYKGELMDASKMVFHGMHLMKPFRSQPDHMYICKSRLMIWY